MAYIRILGRCVECRQPIITNSPRVGPDDPVRSDGEGNWWHRDCYLHTIDRLADMPSGTFPRGIKEDG